MDRPRILVADDHRMVAEGLRSVLEPDFELIEIVEDGRAWSKPPCGCALISSWPTSPCPS